MNWMAATGSKKGVSDTCFSTHMLLKNCYSIDFKISILNIELNIFQHTKLQQKLWLRNHK